MLFNFRTLDTKPLELGNVLFGLVFIFERRVGLYILEKSAVSLLQKSEEDYSYSVVMSIMLDAGCRTPSTCKNSAYTLALSPSSLTL